MRRAVFAAIVLPVAGLCAWWWVDTPEAPRPQAAPPPPPEPEPEPGVGEVVVEWQSALLEALAESARQAEAERAAALPAPPPAPAPPEVRPPAPRRIVLRGDPEKPTVLAPPPPRGELDRETVKKAVASVNPDVKDCYRQGLAQDPSLAGTVLVSFVIEQKDGEGRITGADLDPEASTMTHPFVQACVLEALGKARFPVPETSTGRQKVRFPFTMRTKPR